MKTNKYIKELEETLLENFNHVKENGYSGYDPQVYWYLYFTRRAKNNPNFLNKVFRKLEIELINFFPKLLFPYLKLLKIDGIELVPYGLGLYIQAYVNMYKYFNDEKYLVEAEKVALQLESMLVILPNGLGAPNSKKNSSLKFNNGYTNNETVYLPSSAEVFEGFYKIYSVTKRDKYLNILEKMISSFVNDHKVKNLKNSRVVLNYSSISDDTHILNANALASSCIAKFIELKPEFRDKYEYILKGIYNYLEYYLKNYKFLPYAGEEDSTFNKNWNTCDTYHTGFTLRGGYILSKFLDNNGSKKIICKVKDMLQIFIDTNDKIIIHSAQKKYKQDIHAIAEYIHIYAMFYNEFSIEEKNKYLDVCMKNIRLFKNKGGYLYTKNKYVNNDIYMPRWAQAPMMNSISLLLLEVNNSLNSK